MPPTRKPARSSTRISKSHIEEALSRTLEREFNDYATTQTLPAADNARERDRYLASRRRLALASPHVGIAGADIDNAERQGAFGYVMDQHSALKGKLSLNALLTPIRLGEGLYDFYPPELPPQGFVRNRKPFTEPYTLQRSDPATGALMLSIPQVGTGRFYASATSFSNPVNRYARAWSGTIVPIDPALHDDAHGPKDVVVWAEGTLGYDYTLSAPRGAAWDSQPAAAKATVNVMARLLRFSRHTGQLMADPDANLSYLAHREILDATLLPNGVTTAPPSAVKPSVGGPYAAWSSGPTSFAIDLRDGTTRLLATDSTYHVAVICAVSIDARAAGQGATAAIASAEASAQLFLRLVTLGVLPHDPKVTF